MLNSPKTPNQIDINVGAQIRQRRTQLRMSQKRLADAIGVAFQQVQKYENGINRVGASRLQAIADVFEVPVSFFFEGAKAADHVEGPPLPAGFTQFVDTPEAIELITAFARIEDNNVRRKVVALVKALAHPEAT